MEVATIDNSQKNLYLIINYFPQNNMLTKCLGREN